MRHDCTPSAIKFSFHNLGNFSDEEFHDLQLRILEKYWEEFADTEENKHIYMSIFMEYVSVT